MSASRDVYDAVQPFIDEALRRRRLPMRIGSLFSGYGGLDLAVAAHYGATVAWHVEFDKHPSAILAHHYPDIPNYGDVSAVDWSQVEPVDIITGGYPCQPFSHAGQRRGINDERHLWPYVADAIRVLRPRLCVFENVPGHLTLGFDTVLADLAGVGFDAEWGVVSAAEAGAPHRRQRLFIVATDATRERIDRAGGAGTRRWDEPTDGGTDPDLTLLPTPTAQAAKHAAPTDYETRPQDDSNLWVVAARLLPTPKASDGPNGGPGMRNGRGVADALPGVVGQLLPTPTSRDHKGRNQRDDATCLPGAVVDFGPYAAAIARWEQVLGRPAPPPTEPGTNGRPKLSAHFVEWLMGLPDGWVTGVGIPRSAQLKALGNGVVPQQAALALAMLDGDGAAVPPKTVKGLR